MVIRLTIALLLLSSSILHAQTENDSTYTKALSFRFNGLNLGEFRGGIGGKYWVSYNRAITVSILFGHNSNETKTKEVNAGNIRDSESSFTELGFFTGYEFHINRSKSFSPYLGFGVSLVYNRSESHLNRVIIINEEDIFISSDRESDIFRGAFEIAFGGEYWVTERLSFAGHQTFTIGYSRGSTKTRTSGNYNFDTSSFSANVGTSSLILSLYF
ncbi:outer membrane beta-barrel protein [candidate division KSB1 bacterium]|nr:outer membrane beta-barrel protein [candidate division KSB1 bacterium]